MAATRVVIATSGDMLLSVGPNKDRELLVSSTTLATSSPYFKALTGPNFSEGQAACTSQNPREIVLKDDDAQAMEDLCMLLHGQEPDNISTNQKTTYSKKRLYKITCRLLNLAIVIDKYGCATHLKLPGAALIYDCLDLLQAQPRSTAKCMAVMVATSYLLDSERCFRISTERFTREYTQTNDAWLQKGYEDVIPDSIRGRPFPLDSRLQAPLTLLRRSAGKARPRLQNTRVQSVLRGAFDVRRCVV